MRPSFKDYTRLSQVEHLSEEELNEIFGKFFGKEPAKSKEEKVDALKKKEAEYQQKIGQVKSKKELEDEKWEKAKQQVDQKETEKIINRMGYKKVGATTMKPSGATSAQARGRAGEIDWRG